MTKKPNWALTEKNTTGLYQKNAQLRVEEKKSRVERGITPPPSHRTVLETLTSYGSYESLY
jgi:hypothetical protein